MATIRGLRSTGVLCIHHSTGKATKLTVGSPVVASTVGTSVDLQRGLDGIGGGIHKRIAMTIEYAPA